MVGNEKEHGSKLKNHVQESTSGELLHTKHAFPPNNLGYCGPDTRGKILDHLHSHSTDESLLSILTKFEAAYPFVKMIAKSTGMKPFDYQVAEAYWLGNSLLDHVEPAEFFEFAHQDLASSRKMVGKSDGLREAEAKSLFRELGHLAKPHHTFYVLGMYARSTELSDSGGKMLGLMDSCRISWGKVVDVRRETLVVERPSLTLTQGKLALTRPKKKEIQFDPEISPFSNIRKGDWVSVHWNFASEKLKPYQLTNLRHYTALDIEATNRLVASRIRDKEEHDK
jgi:hypothetical protein